MRVPACLLDWVSKVPIIQDHVLCRTTINHVPAGSTSISIMDDFMACGFVGEKDRNRLPPDKDTVFPKVPITPPLGRLSKQQTSTAP